MTKQELVNKIQSTVYANTTGNVGGRSLPALLIEMVGVLGCEENEKINKAKLVNAIRRNVYFNQTGDISGSNLQSVLLQMVDELWCESND